VCDAAEKNKFPIDEIQIHTMRKQVRVVKIICFEENILSRFGDV
jgi:hypothetical protein